MVNSLSMNATSSRIHRESTIPDCRRKVSLSTPLLRASGNFLRIKFLSAMLICSWFIINCLGLHTLIAIHVVHLSQLQANAPLQVMIPGAKTLTFLTNPDEDLCPEARR